MACLFCSSSKMPVEFWATGYDAKDNPFYVEVMFHGRDTIRFHTKLNPPDIVQQWIRDGGLCKIGKFIPWAQVREVAWGPSIKQTFIDVESDETDKNIL